MDTRTGTAAFADSSTSGGRFEQLEQTLELSIENCRHLCLIASDFHPGGQPVLNQKLHTMVSGLQELDQMKERFKDVSIPLELLQTVDEGKNPQLYTRECMEWTNSKNKECNGKIELLKKHRALVMRELSEDFPKQMMQYRSVEESRGGGRAQ